MTPTIIWESWSEREARLIRDEIQRIVLLREKNPKRKKKNDRSSHNSRV